MARSMQHSFMSLQIEVDAMFRRYLVTIITLLVLPAVCSAASITYSRVKVGRTIAHVVTADLGNRDVKVSVALAKGGTGHQESFKSMMRRTRPAAAITGTFFDTKTLIPTGDIAVYGTLVHKGCIGAALCIDSQNKAHIVGLREGRKTAWLEYETVLCAGPRLVTQGKVSIALKKEGFHNGLCAPARRTAVGITKSGKLVLVTINRNVSLHDIARALICAGAVDGLCLDGGSSTAFYNSGSYLAVPSRLLTNCLVIYSSNESYQTAKINLAPSRYFAQLPGAPAVSKTPSLLTQLPLLTLKMITSEPAYIPATIRAARR